MGRDFLTGENIIEFVSGNTDFTAYSAEHIGKGASGGVYKVLVKEPPFSVAVKVSEFYDLLKEEYETLEFISSCIDCKLPKLYYFGRFNEKYSAIIMEYLDGISGDAVKIPRKHRQKICTDIVDNLIKIHSVCNDKFGPINNAVYETWSDYYSVFSREIYEFSKIAFAEKRLNKKVFKAVEAVNENLDKMLSGTIEKPSLIHGDYWIPNFVINPDTYDLVGVVDPFNVMWAEPEYELFALTVGKGKKLKLYENYKNKMSATDFCDMRLELYALFNELNWYKKLGSISHSYLYYRAKRLLKQMKRNKII